MCAAVYRQRHLVNATGVTAGLAESNDNLLLGLWRDSLHVTCGLTACTLEVCMGMGKTGIPWVPWDSHENGNKISHGMGMGWEWELSAWEWELRRGSCHQQL